MSIPYTEFRWMWPPRTKSRIPYKSGPVLDMWKKYADSTAQYKMNGTNTQIVVHPNRTIELWSRHKEEGIPQRLKQNYQLLPEHRRKILDITPAGTFSIYNAELMHFKTENVKDTLYFFDTLVYDGQYLLNVEYRERHKLIWEKLEKSTMPLHETQLRGGLYVAQNIPVNEWDAAWQNAQSSSYVEGLILKRLGSISRLKPGLTEVNNAAFLCRIRKPTKNYQH